MTYLAQETSTQDGQPVELYLFYQKGGANVTSMTSGQSEVEFDGRIYVPESVKRTSPQISQKSSSGNITITLPRTNSFAKRYLFGTPPLPDSVIIYRGHSNDGVNPEFVTFFQGDVSIVKFKGDEAQCSLTTLSNRLANNIPKRTFSWACNHVLYDAQCQVGRETFRSDAIITSVSDDGLEVGIADSPTWAGASVSSHAGDGAYFNGGSVSWLDTKGKQSRSILFHSVPGNLLIFQIPFEYLPIGAVVSMYAGCEHTVYSCKDRFNNTLNYGGFPYVPSTNPFAEGLLIDVSWQPWD